MRRPFLRDASVNLLRAHNLHILHSRAAHGFLESLEIDSKTVTRSSTFTLDVLKI